MLASWLELPGAVESVGRWSELADVDLQAAGTTWTAEQVRDTAVAQPLLTVAALLSGRALLGGATPAAICGHSVGELPALALAGVLTDEQAVSLAALRGRAMAEAARLAPTGMAAVLGGDAEDVSAAGIRHGLEVATVNIAGQVVLGGPLAALQALAAAPPAGARVKLLEVAGAFHTSAMAPARESFAAALADLVPADPHTTVIANRDGAVVSDGPDALSRLLEQLTSPVRFDRCLATLAGLNVGGVVELAPGGTLTALAKRSLPDLERVALRTPADLPAARALVSHVGEQPSFEWQALPSPDSGVVDPLCAAGSRVAAGDPVAVVAGRAGASTVLAPMAGTLTEWLVSPGDPVRAGQLLAVLA